MARKKNKLFTSLNKPRNFLYNDTYGRPTRVSNIGVIVDGKKVKLTNLKRKGTIWIEVSSSDSAVDVWRRLNEHLQKHISGLIAFRLEDVKRFLSRGGKGKLVAYKI